MPSQRSGQGNGVAVQEFTQQQKNADGTIHIIHLAVEGSSWSDELQGYLFRVRAKEEEPALIKLNAGRWTPADLPTKQVKNANQFTPTDLHTDITVTKVLGEKEGVLEYFGKETLCQLIPVVPSQPKQPMFSLAGTPGTRIDLSPLFTRKQQVAFLGRTWQPMSDKQAIILVTKGSVEALNVKVSDIK